MLSEFPDSLFQVSQGTAAQHLSGRRDAGFAHPRLKLARHIVRSWPTDSVLLVNLELCTLHLQKIQVLAEALSFLIFGDGCVASLISAGEVGLAMDKLAFIQNASTRDLIRWNVTDFGFDMLLSGCVPALRGWTLREKRGLLLADGPVELRAVHPGGRSILNALEVSLCLRPDHCRHPATFSTTTAICPRLPSCLSSKSKCDSYMEAKRVMPRRSALVLSRRQCAFIPTSPVDL